MTASIRYPHTADGLLLAIGALGTTPEAVATNLSAMGFRGMKDDPTCCPIANYLRASVTETLRAFVQPSDDDLYVRVESPDGGMADVIVASGAALRFALRFDLGDYPDLIGLGPIHAA